MECDFMTFRHHLVQKARVSSGTRQEHKKGRRCATVSKCGQYLIGSARLRAVIVGQDDVWLAGFDGNHRPDEARVASNHGFQDPAQGPPRYRHHGLRSVIT
jgi:hypothetical protein